MSFYSEEMFLKFVYYLNEFHKLGADVESYSFSQEGVEYYRFVLVDKTIASNLETIKELKNLLENPKHTVNEQKIVESKIKDILRELDKPISIYQHK